MFIADLLTLWSVWEGFQDGDNVHIQGTGVNKKILKSIDTEQEFLIGYDILVFTGSFALMSYLLSFYFSGYAYRIQI